MYRKQNKYELLNLTQDATSEEIKHAYHEAARKQHPDVNKSKDAAELFLAIQDAYETLAEAKRRAEYDKALAESLAEPVVRQTLYSRNKLAHIDETQIIYSLLKFSPSDQSESQPDPAINICLILDHSTSMQGERMDMVKLAAIEMIRHLKPYDTLSLVAFSDKAEVLLPASKRPDKKKVETQIQMLRPGGGTEIYKGLEAGFKEVQNFSSQALVNHIILLTDGRTYGDEENCLVLADKAALQGIRITGLGIGTEWNDRFIDDLTARTGGHSTYISQNADIKNFLEEKFIALTQIYAEKVILKLECSPGVALNSAYRLQPDPADLRNDTAIFLGSIPKNRPLSILLEFLISPFPAETERLSLAAGTLSMLLPTNLKQAVEMPIRLSRFCGGSIKPEMPPEEILRALSQITLYKMQEKARQEVTEGQFSEASLRLKRIATQLFASGNRDLAQTAMIESERIQNTYLLSAEGEKTIKYGTRSLLLPAYIGENEK